VSTTNVPIPRARVAQLQGGTLAVTQRERADFAAMTAGKMAAGGLGGAIGGAIAGVAAVKEGNRLITERNIPDPAVEIARQLSAHAGDQLGFKLNAEPVATKATSDTAELATTAAGKAAYLLDVQTINWTCIYQPLNWTKYNVLYSAKLRLIDVAKKELVAEGFFSWATPKEGEHPGYDELFADNGKALRTQLDTATKLAVAHFKEKVLAR
jgi:hypothetical protein